MTVIILITVITFGGLLVLALRQKPDTTSPEEIMQASTALSSAISEAEETVGKYAPHDDVCQKLLYQARECQRFSGRTSRLVVSAWMIKQKRWEGVALANSASKRALEIRQLP